jgi:lambda repressor-like predicted transcriptional regulator
MAQRRSAEEIHQILERFRASGLSQMEYCRQTGMVLSTLGRYLRRVRSPEQQLVSVKLEAPPEPGTGFVVILGNGRRIASGWGFGEADLARLIRVAESA